MSFGISNWWKVFWNIKKIDSLDEPWFTIKEWNGSNDVSFFIDDNHKYYINSECAIKIHRGGGGVWYAPPPKMWHEWWPSTNRNNGSSARGIFRFNVLVEQLCSARSIKYNGFYKTRLHFTKVFSAMCFLRCVFCEQWSQRIPMWSICPMFDK